MSEITPEQVAVDQTRADQDLARATSEERLAADEGTAVQADQTVQTDRAALNPTQGSSPAPTPPSSPSEPTTPPVVPVPAVPEPSPASSPASEPLIPSPVVPQPGDTTPQVSTPQVTTEVTSPASDVPAVDLVASGAMSAQPAAPLADVPASHNPFDPSTGGLSAQPEVGGNAHVGVNAPAQEPVAPVVAPGVVDGTGQSAPVVTPAPDVSVPPTPGTDANAIQP